jgi:ATP-dependent RNA helicase DeaD
METFDQLTLKPSLLRAVKEMGYEKPSPIQAQALPVLLGPNTDFIGLAATGTGKTAAFSLPMLERLDPHAKGVQAIIVCPTRELCMQVSGQVNLLGKYHNVRALPIYGGAGYDEQLRGLRKGVAVVVGTPGRVIDHMKRGTLKLGDVKVVVLDEADEMISMGFREDMETILEGVPRESSNIWLFSATMSSAVRRVADDFLVTPKMVQVNRTEMLSSTVEQFFYMTQEKNKPEVLCKLIDAADDFYGVIFCQMKALVVDLTRYLVERGYKAEGLQGDMSQGAREATMNAFRQKRVKILVCTDVASRGIDVKDITHVVNYSLPRELDNYVHRIGRTARSGKTGIAMSLVTPSHRHLLSKIERMTKSRMTEGVVPTRRSIGVKKISQMIPQFTDQETYKRALELMDDSWKQAIAGKSAEEVTARFLALMYPYVFSEKAQAKMERAANASSGASATAAGGHTQQAEGSARPTSADRKSEHRDQKRRFKRDFKKKFVKGFHHKKKFTSGGDQPPRRRPNE